MKLVHYSKKPLPRLETKRQNNKDEGRGLGKPMGLWVSVVDKHGDGWRDWCKGEEFARSSFVYGNEITLRPNHRILFITSVRQFDAFWKEYRTYPFYRPYGRKDYIDWKRVAQKYDGVIIAPYIWCRRLRDDAFWYYGWDCASGCIWRARAVKSIRSYRLRKGWRAEKAV